MGSLEHSKTEIEAIEDAYLTDLCNYAKAYKKNNRKDKRPKQENNYPKCNSRSYCIRAQKKMRERQRRKA